MISKSQMKLVRSLEQKKHRQREGLFVAEGPKVVGDLLAAHFRPYMIFSTDDFPFRPAQGGACQTPEEREVYANAAAKCFHVTDDELRRLSFLQHPQQVLAVFELPAPTGLSPKGRLAAMEPPSREEAGEDFSPREEAGGEFSLALDGVQDPGNLGTIIRLADWYAIDTIYCSPDTADAWSTKVVQSTMGSIARVRVVYTDLVALLGNASVPVYGTVLDGENIYAQQLSPNGIVVMGNEGNGISAPVRQLLTHRLLIPRLRPGAESLNVAIATAIVCSEFRRTAFTSGSE